MIFNIKNKLYIYPNAKNHVHDSMEHYRNTVPLSEKGIKENFIITTNPKEADYFYMGQISNDSYSSYNRNTFKYLKDSPQNHIGDIEGEGGRPIPYWLQNSIITTMGSLKKYSNIEKLFTRPTFSHLLIDIIRNQNEKFSIPSKKSFGFRGYLNHKMRAMMLHSLHHSDFEKELHFNKKWSGPSEIGGKVQQEYIETMKNNLISLCPRGTGIDSVRLVETCYYSRVPVLISDDDYYLVGEENGAHDFVFRIVGHDLNPELLREKLQIVYDTPLGELHDRAHAARQYFDSIIRNYFEDPTAYFLQWLKNEY